MSKPIIATRMIVAGEHAFFRQALIYLDAVQTLLCTCEMSDIIIALV
jgi:hypothetical protein